MDPDAASLKDIERRQPKYWNMDGLPQLVTGVGWLLWGGLYLIGLSLLEGRSYRLYWVTVTFFLMPWGSSVQRVLGELKERMTYPRAGYARMPIKGPGIVVRIVAALAVGFCWLRGLDSGLDLQGFGLFLVGCVVAMTIALAAMRADSSWVWLACLALVIPPRAKTPNDAVMYWALVCMGLIGIAFGAARLRRFLRENPKPAETEA